MTQIAHKFPTPDNLDSNEPHLRMPLFSLTGAQAGPRLVVVGPDGTARHLARVFWDMPELVRMRGSLVIRNESQDPVHDLPDDVLELDGTTDEMRKAHLCVLGRMTALGMIEGRGIPIRWIN